MRIISVVALVITAANFFFVNSASINPADNPDLDTLDVINPQNHYILENQLMTTLLSRYHYNSPKLDDSLSSIIYDRFIKSLDHGKNYFLLSDIIEFEKHRYNFDDYLYDGNIDPFYEIFEVFRDRMRERIFYIDTVMANEFDYTKDENLVLNREEQEWAASYSDLNELWRKRIKNDALNLRLNGKDRDQIITNLTKRYGNYSRILTQYNSEDVFQIAMNSYAGSIDPHTNYLSPISSENFRIDMSLSFEGIGARLSFRDGYTTVVEIIPGGPAFKSKKLRVDDRIVGVAQGEDGEIVDVVGWRITDVVQLIRGPKESIVRLQILPAEGGLDASPVEIKLIRDKIKLEDQSASSEILEIMNDGIPYKIGVITIPKFYIDFEGQRNREEVYKSTTIDVKNLLEELRNEKVDGIIIDLRNNGGGALSEAVNVTGLFIKKGPVVQVKQISGKIRSENDTDPEIVYDGPLAVMVNRFSASASEIFSSAIQDYGRGIVVGEQTYGKGTVQHLIDLNKHTSPRPNKLGQLKLTIAKYYRISGGSTQNLGVVPDIKYPSYVEADEFGESSEPTALPWDQIEPTEYERFSDLSKLIPELLAASNERTGNNYEFDNIREDIAEYRNSIEKNYISLNEQVRKKEKEDKEERKFQRENERRKSRGLKLLEKDETPPEEEEESDPFLNETAMIISDMIKLNKGITQIN